MRKKYQKSKRTALCTVSILILALLGGCGTASNTADTQAGQEATVEVGSKEYIYNLSAEAYNDVNAAYDLTASMGNGIYKAWLWATSTSDSELTADNLANELNCSKEELLDGVDYAVRSDMNGLGYTDTDEAMDEFEEDSREDLLDFYVYFLDSHNTPKFQAYVSSVVGMYKINGTADAAKEKLDAAKSSMKELSADYSDYEHYPALKDFYTTTSSYYEFCIAPEGSFEQYTSTQNDYQNDARNAKSQLDFIFEK